MSEGEILSNEAFEAFYDKYWKYVYRICFTYFRREAEAEDCTEDVFVKVLNGSFVFENEVHEKKWLAVTASNLCKDRLKSHAVKYTVSLDEEDMPEPVAPEKEDLSDVQEAVLGLPDKYKEVVWLYYYDGYATDEIAEMLDRPASTIRNQLRDARNILKGKLQEFWDPGGDP